MPLLYYLSSLSAADGVFVIVVIPAAALLLLTIVFKRYTDRHQDERNIDVIGFKFAAVSTIYAVVLGFATIAVWDRYTEAEIAVVDEANAIVAIVRITQFDHELTHQIQDRAVDYLSKVRNLDWPAMSELRESDEVTDSLNNLYGSIIAASMDSQINTNISSALLGEAKIVSKSRRIRINRSLGVVPDVMWIALFGGAVAMFCFLFLFQTRDLKSQLILVALFSSMILLPLDVIIGLNYPFAGSISVGTNAVNSALSKISGLKEAPNRPLPSAPHRVVSPSFILPDIEQNILSR